jgi:hypothetical protein
VVPPRLRQPPLGGVGARGGLAGLAPRPVEVVALALGAALGLLRGRGALVGEALGAREVGRRAQGGVLGRRDALLGRGRLARLLLDGGAELVGGALALRGLGVQARGLAVEVPADGAGVFVGVVVVGVGVVFWGGRGRGGGE